LNIEGFPQFIVKINLEEENISENYRKEDFSLYFLVSKNKIDKKCVVFKKKKCVAYPQENFLFIKLITSLELVC
jgi:hypothetical protein